MNNWFGIALILLLGPLAGLAHGENPRISISGYISDQQNQRAVEGATISLEKNGQIIQLTQSDHTGNFSLNFEGPVSRLDQFRIHITHRGFKSTSILPLCGHETEIDIELERKQALPIIKPVRDSAPSFAI